MDALLRKARSATARAAVGRREGAHLTKPTIKAVVATVAAAAGCAAVLVALPAVPGHADTTHQRAVRDLHADTPPPPDDDAARAATKAATAPYGLDRTFDLHSRPASTRKVYLDFTGHLTRSSWWSAAYGDITSARYDIDGAATFGYSEHAVIQRVWQSMREDFAPFDVDVTTEDPGVEALRKTSPDDSSYGVRIVVTPSNFYGDAGGVAYRGSFRASSDTPAFVFTDVATRPKFVAEAAAHEAGHTLGLRHDGVSAGTDYYSGHGDWGPIMGASYGRGVTQWSRGEYAGASNTEDDLAVIASNGVNLAPDDIAGGTSTSASLPAGVRRFGVIGRAGDVDAFRFSLSGTRTVRLRAGQNVGSLGGNLNLKAVLRTAAGSTAFVASPSATTGIDVTVTLGQGTYYLFLDGVGAGSASSGFTGYGSLGHYSVILDWA